MRKLGENAEIDDTFLDEHVLTASQDLIPWYKDFVKFLASDIVQPDFSFHQWKKFMHYLKNFFWDESYLYRSCANVLIRC